MTDLIATWVMKSVNPPKAGWYMTWNHNYPDSVSPKYYDQRFLGGWRFNSYMDLDQKDELKDDEFDMWCRQPIPPDANAYHQLRAILSAKSN